MTDAGLLARGAAIARDPIKRSVDIAFASAGLILTLPIALAAAAAIRLDSRGPVFYAQPRSGLRGRPFLAWKFRSMVACRGPSPRFRRSWWFRRQRRKSRSALRSLRPRERRPPGFDW